MCVSLDSIKIRFTTAIVSKLKSKEDWIFKSSTTNFSIEKWKQLVDSSDRVSTQKSRLFGISNSRINNTGKIVVELSAKILKNDYLSGITTNTHFKLYERLSELFTFTSYEDFKNNVYTNKVDVTKNIYLGDGTNVTNYLSKIALHFNNHNKFNMNVYSNRNVTFQGKAKKLQFYTTFYNKHLEVTSSKKRSEVLKYVQLQDFTGLLRCEVKCKSRNEIYNIFSKKDYKLPIKETDEFGRTFLLIDILNQLNTTEVFKKILNRYTSSFTNVPSIKKDIVSIIQDKEITLKNIKDYVFYLVMSEEFSDKQIRKILREKKCNLSREYNRRQDIENYFSSNDIEEIDLDIDYEEIVSITA
jgi:hypothetical protein